MISPIYNTTCPNFGNTFRVSTEAGKLLGDVTTHSGKVTQIKGDLLVKGKVIDGILKALGDAIIKVKSYKLKLIAQMNKMSLFILKLGILIFV